MLRQLLLRAVGGVGPGVGGLGPAVGGRTLHVTASRAQWSQASHIVCTPPRVKVSSGEKCLHGLMMLVIWLTPIAYFHTQIKVWRREYGSDEGAKD